MSDITTDPMFQKAVALGLSSAFGLVQLLGQKVPSAWKPQLYVVLSCVLSVLGFYALHSDIPLIQMVIATATAGTAVTGGIHFYKNDVQGQSDTTVITTTPAAPTA